MIPSAPILAASSFNLLTATSVLSPKLPTATPWTETDAICRRPDGTCRLHPSIDGTAYNRDRGRFGLISDTRLELKPNKCSSCRPNLNSIHSLGKGEVLSSILSGSTTKPLIAGLYWYLGHPSRQFPAGRYANSTHQNVENPWTLFTARSTCLRSRCNRKALSVTSCRLRRSPCWQGAREGTSRPSPSFGTWGSQV
jgi:hypothetical protein